MRRQVSLLSDIIAALVCVLLISAPVWSEEAGNGERVSSEKDDGTSSGTMLDHAHLILTNTFVRSVVWFDSFFGEYRALEEGYSSAWAIWQNDFRIEQSEGLVHRTSFRAHIRLPKAHERLKLVLTREDEQTAQSESDQERAALSVGEEGDEELFLGLGYDLAESIFTRLTLSGGVRFSIPIEEWIRLRYRYEYPINPLSLVRFTQIGFWNSSDGFGERTLFDVERKLNKSTLFRWTVSGTYSEVSSGYEYGSNVSFLHQLSPRRAIALDLGAFGATRPWITMWNYRVASRYRQGFYRKWLYYEIVPEVTWPKDDSTGKREAVAAITLRFEIQFRGFER